MERERRHGDAPLFSSRNFGHSAHGVASPQQQQLSFVIGNSVFETLERPSPFRGAHRSLYAPCCKGTHLFLTTGSALPPTTRAHHLGLASRNISLMAHQFPSRRRTLDPLLRFQVRERSRFLRVYKGAVLKGLEKG